jgi:SAM-dependent methyltransferase
MTVLGRSFRSRLNHAAEPHVTRQATRLLPGLAPALMQFGSYWPHDSKAASYSRPVPGGSVQGGEPVPPRELWAYYCTTAASYLASGREDCESMGRVLADAGAPIAEAGRILDLGCAAGRMVRWVPRLAPGAEVWGMDIWSTAILWCQDHLTPQCRFAVNTTAAHLPFEDRSFGLVYCGSLFTHIDDLAETWLLELRRVIRPGGHLFFSLNDRHSTEIFSGAGDPADRQRWIERTGGQQAWDRAVAALSASPDYHRFASGDAYMATVGRSMASNVLWDSEVLCERLAYGWRRVAITPESYGHQTTVLLERL